jgi:DNA-binding LacI/PurR family transcriptional regulator
MQAAGVGDGASICTMSLEQCVDSIQQADQPPTAVITYNDQSMPPLLYACWRRGLRVPNDLSAVTFNDSASARYSIPPLTTIAVPGEEMGRRAAQLLLEQIDTSGQAMPVSVVLPERLVVRESSAPPPSL